MVVISIGGSDRIAAVPIGTFFLGSCVISFAGLTNHLFQTQGRQFTFLVGIAIGMVGTVLGGTSLMYSSPALLSMATLCFGAATGIAFYLRFVPVELVPRDWAGPAVALVVSGGVLAAFAGPEYSLLTRGLFGPNPHLEYMGVFMMTGIFNLANALCTAAVDFPPISDDNDAGDSLSTTWKTNGQHVRGSFSMYAKLLLKRSFCVPLAVSTLSWAIMAMPMSLVRVAMTQAGYTARPSLLVIELHFAFMYGTGFITGPLISRFGYRAITNVGLAILVVSIILSMVIEEKEPLALWIVGQLLGGMGWNFGFTGSTVWLTECVDTAYSKLEVQAANDSIMFLLTGAFTLGASYIFEAGGSNVQGWRILNASVIALLTLYGAILFFDQVSFGGQKTAKDQESKARLDSYDESIIQEINQALERERSGGTTVDMTGLKFLSSVDVVEDPLNTTEKGTPYPGMEINYSDDDEDTTPPPPPPPDHNRLRIVDIERGDRIQSMRAFKRNL